MSARIAIVGDGPAADPLRRALAHATAVPPDRADLVIEALPDAPVAPKVAALVSLAERLPGRVPIAVVTRHHTVATLAAGAPMPGRIVGLRLITPTLAEVAIPWRTDDTLADAALDALETAGIGPLPCGDTPGRIVDRLSAAVALEARSLVAGGRATSAVLGAGYDAAGIPPIDDRDPELDAIAAALRAGLGAPDRFPATTEAPAPVADAPSRSALDPDAVARRLELTAIAEAYRLVGEATGGVQEIERGMTQGAGWSEGPFARAGRLGLRAVVRGLTDAAGAADADAATRDRFSVPPLLWQMATA